MSEPHPPTNDSPRPQPEQPEPPLARRWPLEYSTPVLRTDMRSVVRVVVTVAIIAFIILFGISILIPSMGAPRERANRVKCAANLRQIGQGLLLYLTDFGMYPRTCYDPARPPTAFTPPALPGGAAPNETDPYFGPNRPADNDVSAALFLLIRHIDVFPDVFICPATLHEKDTLNNVGAQNRVNFNSPLNLSYSYANPYPSEEALALGYKLDPAPLSTFAIAADRNDGDLDGNLSATSSSPSAVQRAMNSRNHGGEGQNVLYSDGHVEWRETCWAGDWADCIWGDAVVSASTTQPSQLAPARTGNGVDPKLPLDSILLPKKGMGLP